MKKFKYNTSRVVGCFKHMVDASIITSIQELHDALQDRLSLDIEFFLSELYYYEDTGDYETYKEYEKLLRTLQRYESTGSGYRRCFKIGIFRKSKIVDAKILRNRFHIPPSTFESFVTNRKFWP